MNNLRSFSKKMPAISPSTSPSLIPSTPAPPAVPGDVHKNSGGFLLKVLKTYRLQKARFCIVDCEIEYGVVLTDSLCALVHEEKHEETTEIRGFESVAATSFASQLASQPASQTASNSASHVSSDSLSQQPSKTHAVYTPMRVKGVVLDGVPRTNTCMISVVFPLNSPGAAVVEPGDLIMSVQAGEGAGPAVRAEDLQWDPS